MLPVLWLMETNGMVLLFVIYSSFLLTSKICIGSIHFAQSHINGILETVNKTKEIFEMIQHQDENWLDKNKKIVQSFQVYKNFSPNDLENPIHAFYVIRRLENDWSKLFYSVRRTLVDIFQNIENKTVLYIPSTEDVDGAADALLRLQEFYNLTPNNFNSGQTILGLEIKFQFTALDFYYIARYLYDSQSYCKIQPWLNEAFKNYDAESSQKKSVKFYLLMELKIATKYQLGYVNEASELIETWIVKEPFNPDIRKLKDAIFGKTKTDSNNPTNSNVFATHPIPNACRKSSLSLTEEIKNEKLKLYKSLCKNEYHQNKITQLKCFYKADSPLLLLQPVRIEMLHFNPTIAMFHNIISHGDTDKVAEIATSKLDVSHIIASDGDLSKKRDYRTSKGAWLEDDVNPILTKINRLLKEILKMDMIGADKLYVINYGLAGHYLPHYDAVKDEALKAFGKFRNRLATAILYLSEVVGGATVFPRLGVRIQPEKGGILFWFNLLRNGEVDLDTEHAGCLVVGGSKWVANKWIHEFGQEFTYPCSSTNTKWHTLF